MTKFQRQYTISCYSSCRLDVLLAHWQNNQSRNTWKKAIKSGNITVNDVIIPEARHLVAKGDSVAIIKFPESQKNKLSAIDKKLDIIFEDDDLIVVNKPAKLIVHPATFGFNSKACLVNYLLAHSPNKLSHIDTNRPGIIHRLDKDTSGLLLIAKTDECHNFMIKELEARKISRLYLALIFGKIELPQRLINNATRDPKHRMKMSVHQNGRIMVTDIFPVINNNQKRGKARTLLAVRIHTGRTHQIRLQLSYLGFPIIGDRVYGNHTRTLAERQCLHAYTLNFKHPKSKKMVNYSSDLPKDFTDSCISQGININNSETIKLVDQALAKLLSLQTPSPSLIANISS